MTFGEPLEGVHDHGLLNSWHSWREDRRKDGGLHVKNVHDQVQEHYTDTQRRKPRKGKHEVNQYRASLLEGGGFRGKRGRVQKGEEFKFV